MEPIPGISMKKSLFVDRWSRVDHGEIAELRRSIDGKLIKIIGNQDLTPLLREGYQMPIRFVAPGGMERLKFMALSSDRRILTPIRVIR